MSLQKSRPIWVSGSEKGRGPAVGLLVGEGGGTHIVVSPHVPPVAVQVHAVGTVAVIALVFSPHASTDRAGHLVVVITVGIHDRNEIHLDIVHQVLDLRVGGRNARKGSS